MNLRCWREEEERKKEEEEKEEEEEEEEEGECGCFLQVQCIVHNDFPWVVKGSRIGIKDTWSTSVRIPIHAG